MRSGRRWRWRAASGGSRPAGSVMRFRDRKDAGTRLAAELHDLGLRDVLVVAIPRGGVIVADVIARTLGWPLEVVLPRKLRAPGQPELAFGAVAGNGFVYVDARLARALRVTDAYLKDEIGAQIEEIRRRRTAYRGERPPLRVRDVRSCSWTTDSRPARP